MTDTFAQVKEKVLKAFPLRKTAFSDGPRGDAVHVTLASQDGRELDCTVIDPGDGKGAVLVGHPRFSKDLPVVTDFLETIDCTIDTFCDVIVAEARTWLE